MKKKIIIGICILLVIICLLPFHTKSSLHFEDGFNVVYKSILYEIEYVYSHGDGPLLSEENFDGTIVRLFGIEVYNSVK